MRRLSSTIQLGAECNCFRSRRHYKLFLDISLLWGVRNSPVSYQQVFVPGATDTKRFSSMNLHSPTIPQKKSRGLLRFIFK